MSGASRFTFGNCASQAYLELPMTRATPLPCPCARTIAGDASSPPAAAISPRRPMPYPVRDALMTLGPPQTTSARFDLDVGYGLAAARIAHRHLKHVRARRHH